MGTPVSNNSTLLNYTPVNCENSAQSRNLGKWQLMSSTLRERLKKTRRSFHSNFTVAKQLKIDDDKTNILLQEHSVSHTEQKCLAKIPDETLCLKSSAQGRAHCTYECTGYNKTTNSSSEVNFLETDCKEWELLEEKVTLTKHIQEKEELLRRLKLVKMYRSKNNPTELQFLISKWRKSSQAVLYELQSSLSTDSKKLSLTQLIDNFGLNDQLLHYSRTDEDFTDA